MNVFIKNFSWLSASEVLVRIVRILAKVVIARYLFPEDMGKAAIIITTDELLQIFVRNNGILARIIQADEKEVNDLSETGYYLVWLICGFLFITQTAIGYAVSVYYKDPQFLYPIILLACTYFMIPFYSIHVALLMRDNRLKEVAKANAISHVMDPLLTMVFAFLGFNVWSLILPRLFYAPVFILMYRKKVAWRPKRKFNIIHWRKYYTFCRNIIANSAFGTFRISFPSYLIGGVFGMWELGLYSFAQSSGIGVLLGFTIMASMAFYPYICEVKKDPVQFKQRVNLGLTLIALTFIPASILITVFAPWYVPVIFGEIWSPAIPVFMLLCLTGGTQALLAAANNILRAKGKTNLELYWGIAHTTTFILAVFLGIQWGIIGVAAAILTEETLFNLIYLFWVLKGEVWIQKETEDVKQTTYECGGAGV